MYNRRMNTRYLTYFWLVSLCLFTQLAKAEVYKCTGADGRVVFGDQPCTTGQKAAVVKPQTPVAPAAKQAASSSTSDYKSRPEYPECLRLKNKLVEYFSGSQSQYKKDPNNKGEMTVGEFVGGEKALAESRKNMARYKEICGVVDKEGAREEEQKEALKEKPQREVGNAVQCDDMRKNLAELRSIGPAVANSRDRLTPEEQVQRKQEIAEVERQIPLLAKEIEQKCGKR